MLVAAKRSDMKPHEHFVQFYEDDSVLLASVSAFIGSTIASGGAGIVVATEAHHSALDELFSAQGIDLETMRRDGRYAVFDAHQCLEAMLVEGWPDERRFVAEWEPAIAAAATGFSNVAIFAEMVALLWRDGKHDAAVQLERMWNDLAAMHSFALFCAYPMADVAAGPTEAMNAICEQHSRALPTESYRALQGDQERLVEVCKLQQKARMLEREVRRRKLIEHKLASRERELADFLDNAPQAIDCVDADGKIVWANQFELDLLGHTRADYVGHNIAEFHADTVALKPILERLRDGRALTEIPARLRCKDGSIRDVLITSNVRWDNGKFVYLRCFTRDVTDQKRAAEVLRETEERAERSQAFLAAIIESSDDAIVSKSLDSRIKSWNRGAERLFGYSAEEIIGKPITIIIPPELQYEEQDILSRIVKGQRIEHFETVRVAKNGRRIDVSLTISPVLNREGRVIGVSKSARDISDRKHVEELLRAADRRKDEFLAMLGHELRNPLAPIRNVTEVLRRTAGNNPSQESLYEMLERQVQQMTRLLDDLLDVSRISQGKIKFQHEVIDFQTAISRAVEASAPFIERRRHHLSVAVPDGELPMVGDMARLVQMLTNLLNNAAKYTPENGAISFSVDRCGAIVEVRIKDNGAGIAEEMLPRVFDLFVQADRTLRQSQDGMGIGLTLVKSIVEHHAGSVRASSAGVGQGSEFVVRLPMVEKTSNATAGAPAAAAAKSRPTPRRILLVDDNRDLAESLAALLRLSGHEVALAADGWSALRTVQTWPPDVALIDIGLPGMNGYEVARRLRAEGCGARLVAVTGYGGREERAQSQDAGFDDYFVKPIDPTALDQLLSSEQQSALSAASD
jgi:PAS domain S-box-containing protein